MAVAELQAPSKSGCTLADRCGVCATTLSAVEKARTRKKPAVFRRRLDGMVSTPYYAVNEALFRETLPNGWHDTIYGTMPDALALTHAIAVDIRQLNTGVVLGVALVVPSERYLSFIAEGADIGISPSLPAETWREIDAWTSKVDARLPAKPAPMTPSIVAAFLGAEQTPNIIAQRFAAIPITVASRDELNSLADRLLPDLIKTRHSGT